MECKFVVGQKVVCMIDLSRFERPGQVMPKVGGVYTIREIGLAQPGHAVLWSTSVGLKFVELVNPPAQWLGTYGEAAFCAAQFRPVDERKTDISIFEQLLTPAGQRKVLEGV